MRGALVAARNLVVPQVPFREAPGGWLLRGAAALLVGGVVVAAALGVPLMRRSLAAAALLPLAAQAQVVGVPLGQRPAVVQVNLGDLMLLSQGGVTKRMSVSQLLALVPPPPALASLLSAATVPAAAVLAGPASGFGAPAFRALALGDLPAIPYASLTGLPTLGSMASRAAPSNAPLVGFDASGLPYAVTLGSNLTLSGGVLSAAGAAGSTYTLPAATSTTLGGITVSTGLAIGSGGALGVAYGTAAGTAAQGNDPRIVGAYPSSGGAISGSASVGGTLTVTGAAYGAAPAATDSSGQLATTSYVRAAAGTSVSAAQFCSPAQMTGAADAAPSSPASCLQAASDYLCAQNPGGGKLFIPAGYYRIDGTWTIACAGIEVAGAGQGDRDQPLARGTMLAAAAAGGSAPAVLAKVTKYTDGSGNTGAPSATERFANGFTIHDLQIYNGEAGAARSGPFLQMDGWTQACAQRLTFYGTCTAVSINGGLGIHVSDVLVKGTKPNCYTIQLAGGTAKPWSTTDVVSFDRVLIDLTGANSGCWRVQDRVQTVWWRNTTCEAHAQALYVTCAAGMGAGNCPGFFTLFDFESEYVGTGGHNLIHLEDVVDGFRMSNSWLRGGQAGVGYAEHLVCAGAANYEQYATLGASIDHSWLKYSNGSCLYLTGNRTAVTGNSISGCAAGGYGAGIELRSGYATITGNVLCGGDFLRDITWRMLGGYIPSGVDYTTWTGNVFSGDAYGLANGCTAGVSNGSAASHNVIASNAGP